MEQKIKLVETRLKKDIEKPIHEIKGSEELIEATAAQVLSRKTDSAAFVYVNPQLRVVTMQISSIKTLERHKEEMLAIAISHNVGAVFITSNIKYEYGNLKAVEFLDNWQQAFFNAGVPVLEHLQTWIDENGDLQSYSFRNEGLIVDFDRLGISQIPNNDIVISKSKFFSSQLEIKEIGEFDIGEVGDLKGAISAIAEDIYTRDKEHSYVLSVDENNNPINVSIVAIGSLTEVDAGSQLVFRVPILSDAKGVYFIHNHPSGDTTPSYKDVIVLSRLIASGEELGIKVIDGLIVSCYNADVCSIKDNALVDDSYYNNVGATSLNEEVFQYQVKENTMKNQLEQYANENYEGFIKDLISLEK